MKKSPIIIILTILTLWITATTIAYGTDPNTVAVWHFDEGEGSTARARKFYFKARRLKTKWRKR